METTDYAGDRQERREREMDTLARLAVYAREHRLDPASDADRAFHEWLARDARAGQRSGERRATEARAERFARRMHALVLAKQLGVMAAREEPVVHEARDTRIVRERFVPWPELGVAAGVGRELWDEPCERWIELPQNLAAGHKYVALTVSGSSMEPALHAGDVVLVCVGTAVRRDSIVVARRPEEGYVVKAVGKLSRRAIELRSLNPEFATFSIPRDDALIVGTVVMRWCSH
ncbi:MAG: S24 family peptidase [Gemmatimonadaceae bacterium]